MRGDQGEADRRCSSRAAGATPRRAADASSFMLDRQTVVGESGASDAGRTARTDAGAASTGDTGAARDACGAHRVASRARSHVSGTTGSGDATLTTGPERAAVSGVPVASDPGATTSAGGARCVFSCVDRWRSGIGRAPAERGLIFGYDALDRSAAHFDDIERVVGAHAKRRRTAQRGRSLYGGRPYDAGPARR